MSAYLDKDSDNYISLKKVMLRMIFSPHPPVAHILQINGGTKEQTEGKQGGTDKTAPPIQDYLTKGIRHVKGKTRRALKIARGFPVKKPAP